MQHKSPTSSISGKTILIVLLALFGCGFAAAMSVPLAMPFIRRAEAERRARLEGPFIAQMAAYTARFTPAPAAARDKKLQGKILVINPVTKTMDALFYELHPKRQAQTPDEVGVLMWLDCHSMGDYTYSGAFVIVQQEYCKITLIDWKTRRIVQEKEFTGKPPPEQIVVGESSEPLNITDFDTAVHRDVLLDWLYSQVE